MGIARRTTNRHGTRDKTQGGRDEGLLAFCQNPAKSL